MRAIRKTTGTKALRADLRYPDGMGSNEPARRSASGELVAQLCWMIGVLVSYFVGTLFHPLAAAGTLAATFAATLLLAYLATGLSAVPRLAATLALQAPLIIGLGLYSLGQPVGYQPSYACFFWGGTDLELVLAFACITLLSAPIAFFLRMDRDGLGRLRAASRAGAPILLAVSLALVLLGWARAARLPALEDYFDTLPVHATLPQPAKSPCVPIEDRRDPKHDPG